MKNLTTLKNERTLSEYKDIIRSVWESLYLIEKHLDHKPTEKEMQNFLDGVASFSSLKEYNVKYNELIDEVSQYYAIHLMYS